MINNFTFHLRTKLVFGEDSLSSLSKLLKENNAKKILIVYGQSFAKKSGLLDEVIKIIEDDNLEYVLLGGIQSNPDISFVRKGVEISKKADVNFILAIGGGSVIDVGKGIAAGFYINDDPLKLYKREVKPAKVLPFGVILTVSAAGSEMSSSSVISDYKNDFKQGFNSELNRPIFAICNPVYTYSLSKNTTTAGIVDILMHTVERFFSPSGENELADYFAIGLLKSVIKSANDYIDGINNEEVRKELMLASSFSHNGITSIGKRYYMPMHQLEHAISALNPSVAHGHGLAIVFKPWALLSLESNFDKFYKFALRGYGSR